MPKRPDIHKEVVIGSGPIILGQAADLIVIVALSDESDIGFRRDWSALGKRSLSRVYGDDEPSYAIETS